MTASDPIDQLARALDQTGAIIAGVKPEQASLPTPCDAWDVRALVNHVVHDVQQFAAMVNGAPWENKDDDVIGDDWTGAYEAAARSLLAAWAQPDVPETSRASVQVTDLAVHGWDIARATAQPTDLDPEIGQTSLEWAKQNLLEQYRGDEDSGQVFGFEVTVAPDAPVYDRLAGFFGRTV